MKTYFVILMLIMGVNIYSQKPGRSVLNNYDNNYLIKNNQHIDLPNTFLKNSLAAYVDSLTMDSIFTYYMDTYNIPGITSIIWKEDKIIWKENYGYRNLEQQLPFNDSTLWLSASISKTILATAIMQLWENGQISLDNDINDYLPEGIRIKHPQYPNSPLTVKMLMTHTSSLIDDWDILTLLSSNGDSSIGLDSLLYHYFTPSGLYYSNNNFSSAEPGTKYEYSNMGCCLLGLAIENMTDLSFDDYTIEHILTPLSMNKSSWFLRDTDTSNLAVQYSGNRPSSFLGFPYYPVGQFRTNILELTNFMKTYINLGIYESNRILDSSTINLMLSDQLGLESGKKGLIWFTYTSSITNDTSNDTWGHSGVWDGARSHMVINLNERFGAIIHTNSNYQEAIDNIGLALAQYAYVNGKILALNANLDKKYIRLNIDSIFVTTQFVNHNNDPFETKLEYFDEGGSLIDSLSLFDNGEEGDQVANDGIYSNFIGPIEVEDIFSIDISAVNTITDKYFKSENLGYFTTAGPIKVDSFSISKSQTGRIDLRNFTLKNYGESKNIDVFAELTTNDTNLTRYARKSRAFGEIEAGSTVSEELAFSFYVKDGTDSIEFTLNIWSGNFVYWYDTIVADFNTLTGNEITIIPTDFTLEQNYPNPFNPSTTIEYQIPINIYPAESGEQRETFTPQKAGRDVKLVVYDLLGRVVTTLVDEKQKPGNYEVEFDGSELTSGIYFYRLKAGDFITTKKMVLLR